MSRLLVNQIGIQVHDPQDATYEVVVVEKGDSEWNFTVQQVRQATATLCGGNVEAGFVSDSLVANTDIILLLRYKTARSELLIGFCMLNLIYSEDGSIKAVYVDVLCANASDRVTGGVTLRPGPGTILLNMAEKYAYSIGAMEMQLSSLAYVLGYYRKQGYSHLKDGEEEAMMITESSSGLSNTRFSGDNELEIAFLIAYAMIYSAGIGTDKDKLDRLVASLNAYLGNSEDVLFVAQDGDIYAYDRSDGKINDYMTKMVSDRERFVPLVNHIVMLTNEGFNVDLGKRANARRLIRKDDDGDYETATSSGFEMVKKLRGGASNNFSHTIHRMPGKGGSRYTRKRRSVPWSGWAKIAPKQGRERDTMKKNCGKKCFLGPKTSFPICAKGTCRVSDKGLWAAYIRAKEWGKPRSSYKGRGSPRHRRGVYTKASRDAKRMLEKRGYSVKRGGSKAKTAKKSKSHCKGKKSYACVATTGCKMAKGKKRSFCRTKKNKKASK